MTKSIARFGAHLRKHAVVLSAVAAPFLGLAAFLFPAWRLGAETGQEGFYSLLKTSIEQASGLSFLLLLLTGVVLGFLGRGSVALHGSMTMAAFPALAVVQILLDPSSHNLWPLEFVIYGLISLVAWAGVWAGRWMRCTSACSLKSCVGLWLGVCACVGSSDLQAAGESVEQAPSAGAPHAALVGEWFPTQTTKGGLGMELSVAPDGTVVSIFGATLAFDYEAEKGQLFLSRAGESVPAQKYSLAEEILIIGEGFSPMQLSRVKGDAKQGLVGLWRGSHPAGAQQTMQFTDSGVCYLTVEMKVSKGSVQGGKVILGRENGLAEYDWIAEGQELVLIEKGTGKRFVHKRKL